MNMHPLQYYIVYGAQEDTSPNPYFDAIWYQQQYSEAINNEIAFTHYLEHSNWKNTNPNPYFDTTWYLENTRTSKKMDLIHCFIFTCLGQRRIVVQVHTLIPPGIQITIQISNKVALIHFCIFLNLVNLRGATQIRTLIQAGISPTTWISYLQTYHLFYTIYKGAKTGSFDARSKPARAYILGHKLPYMV